MQELDKLLGNADERQQKAAKEETRLAVSGVWGVLHGKSPIEQMLSPWFILMLLLTVLQMLKMNFFIATIQAQYTEMLGSRELGGTVNRFFDVALPVSTFFYRTIFRTSADRKQIGGVAATPFIGLLLNNVSTASSLAFLVAMITAVGIVGCLPYLWAGYCSTIIFVLLRPLYYSAMS